MSFKDLPWDEVVNSTYDKIKQIIPNEKKFKDWLLSKETTGRPFDALLTGMCYKMVNKLRRENDKVVVIVGREGSGKSTLAAQLCAMVDPDFSVDNITIGELEFIQALRRGKIGTAVSVDEGGLALFSREAMSYSNRNMVKIFMTIRRKSMLCVICCPSYNTLDTYIRNHRMSLLINIVKRGHYIAYFGGAIKKINIDLHKVKSLSSIKVPSEFFWNGYFNKGFPPTLDYESYLYKKDQHIDDQLAQMERDAAERAGEKIPLMKPSFKVAQDMGLTAKEINKRIESNTIKGKKIGRNYFISIDERKRLGVS